MDQDKAVPDGIRRSARHARRLRRVLIAVVAVLVLVLGLLVAFVRHAGDISYQAANEAIEVYSEDGTEVQGANRFTSWITFGNPDTATNALVFYPGALVSPEAYAPLMERLAEKGMFCVIVRMPANMAFFSIDEAGKVRSSYPQIKRWYLAGHSLGGAMAASYIAKNASDWQGLVLLAAFSTADLSNSGLQVLSVVGSNDTVINRGSLEKYRSNLPTDTVEVTIEGGNHAGYGDYGPQNGDSEASITSDEQQAQTAQAILELVEG